jgi:hypothetical protein
METKDKRNKTNEEAMIKKNIPEAKIKIFLKRK